MKKLLIAATLFIIIFTGCEKEANRKLLNAYFNYEVNGSKINIAEDNVVVGTNLFNCTIKGDSILTITAAKSYDGAGFVVKGNLLHDGTFTLDSLNKAYYNNPKDFKRYTTNNTYKGTVSIKRNTFQAKTLINTLEGTFSFQAVDPISNKTVTVTNGCFLMERHHE